MLELSHVHKVYRVGAFGGGRLRAVRDVGLTVEPGEVVSLIGESGSGKSTLGRMVLGLTRPTSGRIAFEGADVTAIKGFRAKKEYHRKVQGVFQDPFSSFNPIFKAERVLSMIRSSYFPGVSDADWRDRVTDSLRTVRLDPDAVLGKYPHQLSGGQLQRLLIARALLLDIRLLVADEVISMLDASTRIDVLNLLADLKERGLGILFVTHDLSLGTYVSDTTVILRKGAVAEKGPTRAVFADPRHPYSRHLLSCVPRLHRTWAEVDADLDRERPDPVVPPAPADEDGPVPMTEVGEGHFVGADQG
ncbi:ATP-binding cassette domain-containing protein [Nocardiopsis sp. HNM0947]|uniref:ATP-binding cassette domain-containing protein n=1 Tax=Nocardiopsis coralli TaxID=2772213 RepID=A0ABR9P7V1_9ACTN|nr:ATP-binding cassette domain-containing protein [Nocardiopsis coralli]MBE2999925.1 ATP-binding cassette domain-containing protein [Nocardiopsis coralli]